LNYSPERVGIAVYTAGMAESLSADGHSVHVIAGHPYYPEWRHRVGFPSWRTLTRSENGVRITRVPHFIPALPSGRKRLVHLVSFSLSALVPAVLQGLFWRPDVVVALAPSLLAAPVAKLASILGGASSWLHVQDFEVEAATATGLAPAGGFISRAGILFERLTMRSFDRVSSISPEMCSRLLTKGVEPSKVEEFRNWAAMDEIELLNEPSSYRAEWHIETPNVALYSGNIGAKQGLSILIEVARTLRHRSDLTFVVCGNGPNRARLEELASGLPNIMFFDLQPRERLHDLLALATVHLLPQIAEAADLVLPSKLGNMLASGRPVIAIAAQGSGLAREVEGCGAVVEPGSMQLFASAIERLLDDEPARRASAAAASTRAHQRWCKVETLESFSTKLQRLAGMIVARPPYLGQDGLTTRSDG
jgi:colanic acid biosynthesis glycosyl transferase WcaI